MKWTLSASLLATSGLLATGCATTMPPELVQARSTYDRVSNGPTKELNPGGLASAKESLDRANHAYESGYDYYYTRDVAYIAERKAELAELQGKITAAQREKADASRRLASLEHQKPPEVSKTPEPSAEDLEKLSKVAEVKQDERGLVVTLAGGVTFDSGKSSLRPEAKKKLDQVAESLQRMAARTVLVEGHTDSSGPAEFNKRLSLARATEVRNYLVDQGVPEEQIRAEGKGVERPVADNKTPQGRAANRRVEIVVERIPSS